MAARIESGGPGSRGAASALETVRTCLARIEAGDGALHAFLRVNPRAEDEAREVDEGRRTGPLAGVPVAIKDNVCTEGLETTCASRVLEGFVPTRDATIVARLRAAGAIVLGKTNMDEFAMGSSTENSAFGCTRNPWDAERVPGGSSGGSAAAVAAGMATLAIGSDTGGSVRQPAAFCGVVGLKPTYGRVSRSGLVAFASSLDQVGPLAATVTECARLLGVIAGADPSDATSSARPVDDYPAACGQGVRGLRIGLARDYFSDGLDPSIADRVRRAARALEEAGAALEEISLPNAAYAVPVYTIVANAEASSNLARFDGVRYGRRVDPGAGVQEMFRATRGRGFGAEVRRRVVLGTYVLSAGYYDAYYGRAMRARTLIRQDFLTAFRSGIDVILGPTTPSPPFRLGEKVDDPLAMYLSDVYTVSVNLAGLPAMSVPIGLDTDGLPLAAQLIGPDFGEALLFRAGAVVESAFMDPERDRPGGPS